MVPSPSTSRTSNTDEMSSSKSGSDSCGTPTMDRKDTPVPSPLRSIGSSDSNTTNNVADNTILVWIRDQDNETEYVQSCGIFVRQCVRDEDGELLNDDIFALCCPHCPNIHEFDSELYIEGLTSLRTHCDNYHDKIVPKRLQAHGLWKDCLQYHLYDDPITENIVKKLAQGKELDTCVIQDEDVRKKSLFDKKSSRTKLRSMKHHAKQIIQDLEVIERQRQQQYSYNGEIEYVDPNRTAFSGAPSKAEAYAHLLHHSNVVKHPDGHWVSLRCPICLGNCRAITGSNHEVRRGDFLIGVEGFKQHLKKSHGRHPNLQEESKPVSLWAVEICTLDEDSKIQDLLIAERVIHPFSERVVVRSNMVEVSVPSMSPSHTPIVDDSRGSSPVRPLQRQQRAK